MKDFNISSINVNNPSFHPFILVILVAPIFFEPKLRGSFFCNRIDNSKPKGIDPEK